VTTPFTENPQLAEIKRLEADLSNKISLAQQFERMYENEKRERAAERANYHDRAVVGWVKSVLRILLVLIWFGVVITGIPFPVYMTMVYRAPVQVFWSWLVSFVLGICLWVYLHEKE